MIRVFAELVTVNFKSNKRVTTVEYFKMTPSS